MKKNSLIIAFALLLSVPSFAYDFSVKAKNGLTYYLTITDEVKNCVSISAYPSSEDTLGVDSPKFTGGTLEIPSQVMSGTKVYTVTSIADYGFRYMPSIELLEMPSTVKYIGEEAFIGCRELTGIIFPPKDVKIADSAFAECYDLENLSFGSQWKTIDLMPFTDTWVEQLFIPASVSEIKNLKALKLLKLVDVDPNNKHYSGYAGLLYTYDQKVLLSCPVDYFGEVEVAYGTRKVMPGAFMECSSINSIVFSHYLNELSYKEFEDCESLGYIKFRGELPFFTAYHNSNFIRVFALRVPEKTIVYVPSKLMKIYKSYLCSESGVYTDLDGGNEDRYVYKRGFLTKSRLKSF